VNIENRRIHFETDERFYEELEPFYQAVIEQDGEYFRISRDYALGLHLFLETLEKRGAEKLPWLKGQVTGPFSFAMTVIDEKKRSIAYNPELLEVAVQGIAQKARWMARTLLNRAEGALVVLDEPYLCSFGSAFVNVPRDEVITALDASIETIHEEGALAGVHCCGNTDWSLVMETGVDVINLDAFEFFQGLPLYPAELRAFYERGGVISWGIVPATPAVKGMSARDLLAELDDRVGQLESKGFDRALIYRRSLLTPSCGMGTQSVEIADHALGKVVELSNLLREREGLE